MITHVINAFLYIGKVNLHINDIARYVRDFVDEYKNEDLDYIQKLVLKTCKYAIEEKILIKSNRKGVYNITDLTFNNGTMEDKEITLELVLSVFKNYSDKKKLKDIKKSVVDLVKPEGILIWDKQSEVEAEIDNILKEDKSRDEESELVYSKGYYSKRRKKRDPEDGKEDECLVDSRYIGTAGELAVMSELVFRGYNANRMMIDEGVDIIAVKDNLYYYIQVKTTIVKEGRICCQIPKVRFDQYVANQMRYIVVARYSDKGSSKNMFFVFTPQKIQEGIFGRYIKEGKDSISIKIKFSPKTGNPYLYDEKDSDISFYMNRFEL